MKKYFVVIVCMCIAAFIFSGAVYAGNELDFKPVGGGRFIYCNNPEGLDDDMILNGSTPRYIMNNEELDPNMYYIYISHFNFTGNAVNGYDIELDLKMTAREASRITVHKAFFETPQEYAYYKNWNRSAAETDWGQLGVCASMLGIPMCEVRGEDFYYPQEFEPVTFGLEAGETVWLSEYLSNYEPIHFGKAVHIQALVEIESGLADFNVCALKSGEILGGREDIPEDAEYGDYRFDYTLKGVAYSLPEVVADIEYTIDDSTEDGTRIPVFLKNQYVPEGHELEGWFTQLNPQNDIWSKTSAAENDILPLYYRDDSKLSFYGDKVSEDERDRLWTFDTVHSAARGYEPKYSTGSRNEYKPNFVLGTDTDNHTYACNIGNYGVATTYRMTVTNNTAEPKYCSLVLTAAGCVIAYETAEDGSRNYAYVKDLTGEKVTDNMLSHEIRPNSTGKFDFSIILPVNYNGGIKNELVITDSNIQAVDFEEKLAAVETEHRRDDFRYTNIIKGIYADEAGLPDETAGMLDGNRNSYEYLRGRSNAILRWCAWDGAPEWYYNLWGRSNTVYGLDAENNIIGSFAFPSIPCEASWRNGYFTVRTTRDGIYKSADGAEWFKAGGEMPDYEPYYDLENASDWAVPELERGWDLGLRIKYYGQSYNFKSVLSREGFCELAAKLLERLDIKAGPGNSVKFDDTTNRAVARLAAIGVINGFGDGSFRPAEHITREQAAAILARLAGNIAAAYDIELSQEHVGFDYADSNDISDWAANSVAFVYDIGVMNGVGGGMFEPQGGYSAEQSAATVLRLYDYFNNRSI